MFALQQQGSGLLAKQEAAKRYFITQRANEGGRSNRFGKNKMADYLSKIAAVDRKEFALATVGEATAETGRERRQQAMIDKQNQALGSDPQFGMPTMDPGADQAGQLMNSISFGLNVATGIAAISDKRVKDNIDRVGTSPKGYGIFEWNYRGESPDERYRGDIAQDVLKQNPNAVTIIENELLGEYYNKLKLDFKDISKSIFESPKAIVFSGEIPIVLHTNFAGPPFFLSPSPESWPIIKSNLFVRPN